MALFDRDEAKLRQAASELSVLGCEVDVACEASCLQALQRAETELDGIDGIVNSAGITDNSGIEDLAVDRWAQVINVNLTGAFVMCKSAIAALRRAGGGTIVNISSGIGLRPFLKGQIAYASSKGGLLALTKALAVELAPDVRVNVVCPGLVDTPMSNAGALKPGDPRVRHYPLNRVGQAHEIADAILFLTSAESSFVTGTSLVVDGGRVLY